jgi:hypothetical protein
VFLLCNIASSNNAKEPAKHDRIKVFPGNHGRKILDAPLYMSVFLSFDRGYLDYKEYNIIGIAFKVLQKSTSGTFYTEIQYPL